MLISAIAVMTACALSVAQDFFDEREELDEQTLSFGQLIVANSEHAVLRRDRVAAERALSALRTKPAILAGGIYTEGGVRFAAYSGGTVAAPPHLAGTPDGITRRDGRVALFLPVIHEGRRIGTVYITADERNMRDRMREDFFYTIAILLVCLTLAFILSSRLQRSISAPVVELALATVNVSKQKDYSVRAAVPGLQASLEIRDLVTGFNNMLTEIEERDRTLLLNQLQLEKTVALRTRELTVANEELLRAKNSAEKAASVSAQLARQSALILNSATDGIFGVDLDGEPSFLNPAGVRMLGRTLAELRGESIHNLIHHSDAAGTPLPEGDCPLGRAFLRGDSFSVADDTFWRPDGTSIPVEYSATPMLDEDGNKAGFVLIFRDVTERRAIERLKSEFVSTVSHELRTPLTSIRGALGLLSSGLLGPIAEKGQRMLEIAVTNTDRLVRLINDILDLERIESGKVELTRGPVDAQPVMDQAREGLQSMADQAGIRIVVEPVEGTLWGDSDRIIQTLTNLIGNAVKFSPANTTVTLSGSAGATDFTFRVTDEGRGVPDDKLDAIFQRFSQVDASDSRHKGGSGLGLAICQSIVGAHGGRIWAEKNDPVGTRMQFTIPLAARTSVPRPAIKAAPAGVPTLSEYRGDSSVLVVEDDTDLARVMTTALQRHGVQTFHTASGNEAVRLCRQHEPSLIVLDLGLPDLDGFNVVRSLRESETLRHVALLVYSALDVGSADQSRLRLGATEFLTKSRCSLTDFEGHVVRLLEAVSKTKDSQHAA